MPISLVLADDHPLILEGLESLFHLEQDFTVLARCGDGEATLQAVRKYRPDILLLDLCLPRKDGLAVLREMSREKLPTKVVLLTVAVDDDDALEAIRLGVRGIVLKEMAPQLLVQCIRKVHAGEQWVERRSIGGALDRLLRRETAARQLAAILTAREIELVRLVAGGRRNKDIAKALNISEGTVKVHLHHIYEKLKVDGRLALTLYAQEKGLA